MARTATKRRVRLTPKKTTKSVNGKAAAEKEFVVEKILDKKTSKKGDLFLIKWHGWAEKDNTWEPKSNLKGCSAMLAEFEKTFGADGSETEDHEEEDEDATDEEPSPKKQKTTGRGRPAKAKKVAPASIKKNTPARKGKGRRGRK